MRVESISAAQAKLAQLALESQERPICLTKYGKPVAVLIGVSGRDFDDLFATWLRTPTPRSASRRAANTVPSKKPRTAR
jgi:prevent-host-death family protein